MIGRAIGFGFSTARDFVARGLIRVAVTPNMLTLLGVAFTLGAGACYALGGGAGRLAWGLDARPGAPNAYPFLAAWLLILASACDMLDGAVARIADKATRFGAFLDSTLDRLSDFAVYAGIGLYYARQSPANLTFVLASMLAFFNAFMISYTKARAEDIIDSCRAGYWQRGERSAAILIATFSYNVPALLAQQALLPMLTVLRRMSHTWMVLNGRETVQDIHRAPWHIRIRLWRWPRMTVPYDFVTAVNIAWLIFAPVGNIDPLRALLG
jgi:CDP-diacylglycerol--glycerol-3-phosphate 3-phosphatidyltransferase